VHVPSEDADAVGVNADDVNHLSACSAPPRLAGKREALLVHDGDERRPRAHPRLLQAEEPVPLRQALQRLGHDEGEDKERPLARVPLVAVEVLHQGVYEVRADVGGHVVDQRVERGHRDVPPDGAQQGLGELECRDDLPAGAVAVAGERLKVGHERREQASNAVAGLEARDVLQDEGLPVAHAEQRGHPREGEHAEKAGASEQGCAGAVGAAAVLIVRLARAVQQRLLGSMALALAPSRPPSEEPS